MPLDYLRKIARAEFPLIVADQREINCVAILKAAGLIEASIPMPSKDQPAGSEQGPAIVTRITPQGWEELAKPRPP